MIGRNSVVAMAVVAAIGSAGAMFSVGPDAADLTEAERVEFGMKVDRWGLTVHEIVMNGEYRNLSLLRKAKLGAAPVVDRALLGKAAFGYLFDPQVFAGDAGLSVLRTKLQDGEIWFAVYDGTKNYNTMESIDLLAVAMEETSGRASEGAGVGEAALLDAWSQSSEDQSEFKAYVGVSGLANDPSVVSAVVSAWMSQSVNTDNWPSMGKVFLVGAKESVPELGVTGQKLVSWKATRPAVEWFDPARKLGINESK